MAWTAYNIRLSEGRYTMGDDRVGAAELMAVRYLQLVSAFARKPLDQLRVLDLGAMEGLYGLELAAHGASVVAVEGREGNAERALEAADALGVSDRYEMRVADARDLEVGESFDVVLCLGLLYHLPAADGVALMRKVYALTDHLAIIRTAVGLKGGASYNGYRGFEYAEPPGNWSSMGNDVSFWLTRPSLLNLLCDVGFASVVESVAPSVEGIDELEDLAVLVAAKGPAPRALAVADSATNRYRAERLSEDARPQRHPAQSRIRMPGLRRRFWTRLLQRR